MPDAPQHPCHFFLFITALVALVVLAVWLEVPTFTATFDQPRIYFEGPDDYMRTWRARQIADGAALCVKFIPEINAPTGVEMHWTAPMDYVLAAAGWAFSRFVRRDDPFGTVAAMVPLALGMIYLVYLVLVLRRGFGAAPALLAAAVTVLTPPWHSTFCVGHPDHHCLLALFLLLAVGEWIPARQPDGSPAVPRRLAAVGSGIAIGAAIWVGVEAMLFWLVMLAALWIAGTFGPPSYRPAYARARFAWGLSAVLTATVGWLFESWPDVAAVAADKISLVHVILLAIGLILPAGPLRRRRSRYISFLVSVAGFIAWMVIERACVFEYVSRPEFSRWLGYLQEFQPLFVQADSQWSLHPLHSLLGFLPYALPVLLILFFRCRQAPPAAKYMLVALAPIITVLAIIQVRWVDHANLAIMPVVAVGAWELAQALAGRATRHVAQAQSLRPWSEGTPANDQPPSHAPRRSSLAGVAAVILLALLSYPAAATMLFYTTDQARQAAYYMRRTDYVAGRIIAYEAQHPAPDPSRRAVLCEESEGPALLYWTGLPVAATPYHRALDGILEMARFFAERDPAAARRRLDRLGVRYVVMPPRANEQLMACEELAFGELRSFNPPGRSIDEFGREVLKLNYRAGEVSQTMIYRLVMEPKTEVIPGVEQIAEINEGAKTPDGRPMLTGLLYVVHDLPPK